MLQLLAALLSHTSLLAWCGTFCFTSKIKLMGKSLILLIINNNDSKWHVISEYKGPINALCIANTLIC